MVKTMKQVQNDRIIGLNGIRILGLIGVILYHTFPSQVPGGFFGVIIFFVLSGFLSGISINNQLKQGTFHLLSYYKKRFLRLYPALFAVLFCTIGVILFIQPVKLANAQSEVLSILLDYNNEWQINMHADYFANLAQNSPFTHLWYISILLQFEILCPFVCMSYDAIRRRRGPLLPLMILLMLCIASALIMPIHSFQSEVNLTALYYRTDCRIFALLLGLLGGILYTENMKFRVPGTKSRRGSIFWVISGGVVSILLFAFAKGSEKWVYQFGIPLYTLLVFNVLNAVLRRKNLGKILDNPAANYLNKYSYEIYLWQYPVLFVAIILGYTGVWYDYAGQLLVILILSIWLNAFVTFIERPRHHVPKRTEKNSLQQA